MALDPVAVTTLNIPFWYQPIQTVEPGSFIFKESSGIPPAMQIIRYCAENDYNGNPQRVYVMLDEDSNQIAQWDEGYYGFHAVPGPWRDDAYRAERISVSVKKYKRILRQIPTFQWAHDVPGYSHLRQP